MMRCPSRGTGGYQGAGKAGRRQGMALVTVLWVITLLTVIAASFALGMRREAGITHNLQQAAEARLLAEAGVRHAMLMLQHPDESARWSGEGERGALRMGGADVSVRVRHAKGLVDLNHAGSELLDALLVAVGVGDPRERSRIVDNILDWRSTSPHRRLHADGVAGYAAAGREYGPRNGHFPSVDELSRVLGVTPEIYRRLAPMLTVHGSTAGVDLLLADPAVMAALSGFDPASFVSQPGAAGGGRRRGSILAHVPALAGPSENAYIVESFIPFPGGQRAAVRAVVARASDNGASPFVILSLRDMGRPFPAEENPGR